MRDVWLPYWNTSEYQWYHQNCWLYIALIWGCLKIWYPQVHWFMNMFPIKRLLYLLLMGINHFQTHPYPLLIQMHLFQALFPCHCSWLATKQQCSSLALVLPLLFAFMVLRSGYHWESDWNVIGISHHDHTWLVVDLPLWKIWLSQLGWWTSQYMESHKIAWFQSPPIKYGISQFVEYLQPLAAPWLNLQ